MSDSRISGFYRLDARARIDELEHRGWLSREDARTLREGRHLLSAGAADKMIENVIATFGLPLAVAPNFLVNGRDRVVPLVVEEPSIVAALSASASLARESGGFAAHCDESLAIGQVHLAGFGDGTAANAAIAAIESAKSSLMQTANAVHPRLTHRGGGVRDIEARALELADRSRALAVHLLVDTCDAMGANLVNTICEALAPELARLCDARAVMRILSNLTDRSIVTASVRYRCSDLGDDDEDARRTRDAIVLANEIAEADPYRAATHNKGIMNGIDPLAIATGNDWRALEAGAHAYAAAKGRYMPLTRWSVDGAGDLCGDIELPLKVGIVGGTLEANPAAAVGLAISGARSARELAELMAAAGLAQNFAALRALVTTGIQEGHMRLHARSVVAAAGAPEELFDDVLQELVASGEVKDWKAHEILARKTATKQAAKRVATTPAEGVSAAGKVILLGEHAAVYGRHALALPIEHAVIASARPSRKSTVAIPAWGVREEIRRGTAVCDAILLVAAELGIADRRFELRVTPCLPRAMGLGSSAAFAVAVARALGGAFGVATTDERVNAIAFECEKLAHGTPSGVDNTVATYAAPMLFRAGESLTKRVLELGEPPPVVVGCSSSPGSTLAQVAGVRARRGAETARYEALFDQIDELTLAAADALLQADYAGLGRLMNMGHGLLNALEVSTPELECMVDIARRAGALGAKLTGAGGGGSIVALCPGRVGAVREALRVAGFSTIALESPPEPA